MEYESWSSSRSEPETERFLFRSVTPALGFRRSWRNRYSTRFLQPNPRAPAWGFASAGQSLSRMVGAYGLSVLLDVAQLFILACLRRLRAHAIGFKAAVGIFTRYYS